MTVSRALRNQSSISEGTRTRIQRIASELEYKPNPLLSIYQSQVRSRRLPMYQATIGWINDNADRNHWHIAPYNKGLWDGACAQAELLGYRLDEIWLEEIDQQNPEKNIRRFSKVLSARGIHGCILPMTGHPAHAYAAWNDFSLAIIGLVHGTAAQTNSLIVLNEVDHYKASIDYFTNVRIACEQLRASGLSPDWIYPVFMVGCPHRQALSRLLSCPADGLAEDGACAHLHGGQSDKYAAIWIENVAGQVSS